MMRSVATRMLHLLMAVAIVHQLFVSLFMHMPRPGREGDLAYSLHEWVGLAGMAILAAFWVWTLIRRREVGLGGFFPWFSAARRRAVIDDVDRHIRAALRFELPDEGDDAPLAAAVHGLGLLLATAVALSGTALFFLLGENGSRDLLGAFVLDIHGLMANLMWVYVIAHASMALLHEISGHAVFRRIFGT